MPPSEVLLHMYQAFGETAQRQRISHFFIGANECLGHRVIVFNNTKGMIHGFTNKHNGTGTHNNVCFLQVTVPMGMYIRAYSRILDKSKVRCIDGAKLIACISKKCRSGFGLWKCKSNLDFSRSPLILMPGNRMFIKVEYSAVYNNNFWLYFEGILENLRESFNVRYDSPATGYITLHGFDQQLYYSVRLRVSYTLHLLQTHVIMLSFPYFHLNFLSTKHFILLDPASLELSAFISEGRWKQLWLKRGDVFIKPDIYKTSLRFKFTSRLVSSQGFKSLFSFHPAEEEPHKFSGGLFNCSRYYQSFHQHLDCNLRVECQNQEDEAEQCPFSSPLCNTSAYIQVTELAIFLLLIYNFVVYCDLHHGCDRVHLDFRVSRMNDIENPCQCLEHSSLLSA